MPPPPPAPNNDLRYVDFSDDDIVFLHGIVSKAQERAAITRRPLSAIWNLYETELARRGLDHHHDKHFFDFLVNFTLPEYRGRPLLDTFRLLLAQQGIKVQETADGAQEEEGALSPSSSGPSASGDNTQEAWRQPTRRASFTSVYDTTKEITQHLQPRISSRASVSKLDLDRSPAPAGAERQKWRREPLDNPNLQVDYKELNSSPEGRQRLKVPTQHFNDNHQFDRRDGEDQSQSHRVNQEETIHSSLTEDSDLGSELQEQHRQYYSPEHLHQLMETRQARYIDAFNFHRNRTLLHRLFSRWHTQMWDHIDRMRELELQAVSTDRKMLLSTALGLLHAEFRHRVQEANTNRLFEHLYRRAEYARDLYLLGRAFSQWLQFTAEKVEENQVAKRHVLRVKYFRRWHYFTTTQEFRAQQIGLRLHMTMLKKKLVQVLDHEATALARYHDNLTRMVFYRWYVIYLDARAPRLYTRHLLMKTFSCWVTRLKSNVKGVNNAQYRRQEAIVRGSFNTWATKTRIDLGGNHQADAFQRRHVLHQSWTQWRLETKLMPMVSQVSRLRDWRVARAFFGTWILRTRLCIKADQVDRLRIQQNAWTAWNDQLRVNTVNAQIKQRINAQTVYQWALCARGLLLRRLCDQRIKKNIFQRLQGKAKSRLNFLQDRESQVAVTRKRRLLNTTYECWKLQMSVSHELEQIAQDHYVPQHLRQRFSQWRTQGVHVQTLATKSALVEYFFVVSKSLQSWRTATKETQKKRRQEAYARMRRIVKVNLARRSLVAWQAEHSRLQELNGQILVRERDIEILMSRMKLQYWRTRIADLIELHITAKAHDSEHLRSRFLEHWREKLSHIFSLDAQATRFHALHISDLGSMSLRRLSYRAFEVRRREQDADAMAKRHWGKHRRGILRLWAESTANSLRRRTLTDDVKDGHEDPENDVAADDEESPTARRNRVLVDISNRDFDAATDRHLRALPASEALRRVQTGGWITMPSPAPVTFEESHQEADTAADVSPWVPPLSSAATPAYLHTPSKNRAVARAKALAGLTTSSTTPKGTPPLTSRRLPFSARLRGEGQASQGPEGEGRGRA